MADTPMAELKWDDIEGSSNIRRTAYDSASRTIAVQFHNGSYYSYADAAEPIYTGLVHATSVGKYLAAVIKGVYPYTPHEDEAEMLSFIHHRRK